MSLDQINLAIAPWRRRLLEHPIYRDVRSPQALRIFMQYHVFAVWDFMSLLKALQRQICCVSVPWLPPPRVDDARLVNEIVLAEETDENGHGGHASHFELYHQAMCEFSADTLRIDAFLDLLRRGDAVRDALTAARAPSAIARFVGHTFDVIDRGELHCMAAVFTFGREDLLPAVFERIVNELSEQSGGALDAFIYYLLRHVELDGEEHGPMAQRLVQNLCGQDAGRWLAAEQAAVGALRMRLELWDAIHQAINLADSPSPSASARF